MRIIKQAFYLLMGLVIVNSASNAQSFDNKDPKKIVVLGSSVASGWVTSYEEKYDFKNGYAYRLERAVKEEGFEVINKGIPGDNTTDALARFDEDVLPLDPDYVLIGLSMSNEGLETEDPDSVFKSFENGMKQLIAKCEEKDIYPILGQCYANDNFTPKQYDYLKRMNIEMNSWGYPCLNFLGALNDGNGNFPEGTTFDPNHPDDRGHEEFFLAIPTGLFDALETNKKVPGLSDGNHSTSIGRKGQYEQLFYFPSSIMHSFSMVFDFKPSKQGILAKVLTTSDEKKVTIKNDAIIYNGKEFKIADHLKQKNEWNALAISHHFMASNTSIYLNGKLVGEIKERIEPAGFAIGDPESTISVKDLFIYRAGLTTDEIIAGETSMIHASLDFYSPLEGDSLENYAQNTTELISDKKSYEEKLSESLNNIKVAAGIRAGELKVKHKKAIDVDPSLYNQYEGKYVISGDDAFTVEVSDNKIFFIDRGRKAEILPEAIDVFFIKYPGEITFTFQRDENDNIVSLEANFNGYKLVGKKKQ